MSKNKKYCRLCEPFPELIDLDSPVAIGYFLKGKRKVPICEPCAISQKKYNEIIYYEEQNQPKELIKKKCDNCNYEKQNLVTLEDENGTYDIMICRECGNTYKRRGLGVNNANKDI